MNVIKRDDSIQPFDFGKIEKVVMRAFASVNEECPVEFIEQLKKKFETTVNQKELIDVEDIQDIIQKMLIQKNKYDVVQSFIIYRNKRAEVRESKSDLIRDVHKALSASDVQNQNANVDEESFGGRIGEAGRVVCKNDALKRMSKKARKNHENNEIYIHKRIVA